MTDDASRKAFEKWLQENPQRAFKPLTIWQASRAAALAESAKVMEEAERALEPFSEAAQACELWKHPDFILPMQTEKTDEHVIFRGSYPVSKEMATTANILVYHLRRARSALAAIRALKSGKGEE